MSLLAAGVFGHSLGSFTDSVFGQFTGQKQPDGSLDLARTDGWFLVVVGKAGSFGGDALEDVVKAKSAQQRLETADTLRNVRGQQSQALATRLPE